MSVPHGHTPVVFLHAFPLDSRMWSGEAGLLGGRGSIAPDFPGFGARPPGAQSLDGFAESVLEDMGAAGLERAVFVGLSMGGYVAFRLFARSPERVAGLVLADTRAGPDTEAAAQKRTMQVQRVRREGVGWLADTLLPDLLGETTRRDRPEVVARVRSMIDRADPEGVARALVAMRERPDSRALLPGISVPVLAIAGEEDGITPVEEARLIAEAVPDGELAVVRAAGHLANLEHPAAFAEALTPFLARLP